MSDPAISSSTLKGWRTLLLSIGISAVGVLQSADWATIVKPAQVGPVLIGIGILVGVLRAITDTAVGSTET